MKTSTKKSISELTLEEIFPDTLTDTSCVYIDKEREVWVATEMCAQHLESTIDAIVVRDKGKPIGIVGGYDLLDHLRKNPAIFHPSLQEKCLRWVRDSKPTFQSHLCRKRRLSLFKEMSL